MSDNAAEVEVLDDEASAFLTKDEIIGLIRALPDPEKASIPILAITANAFEEDRQAALAAGMNGHIPKPFDTKKLLTELSQFL